MAKSVRARVQDSFREASREDIVKYLDWVRSIILDHNQAMRRMAAFLVLLVAVFEIVANSRNVRITIASFQVTRGSVVLILLPGLVSFLALQMIADSYKANRLMSVYHEVFKLWSEKAAANDLDDEALSASPLYWTLTTAGFREENRTKSAKLIDNSGLFLAYVVLVGILAFEAHAYYVLFPAHVPSLILWLISLCFTLTCLTLAFLMTYWDPWD